MSPLTRAAGRAYSKPVPRLRRFVAATTASTIQPVIARDFPDPAVLAVGAFTTPIQRRAATATRCGTSRCSVRPPWTASGPRSGRDAAAAAWSPRTARTTATCGPPRSPPAATAATSCTSPRGRQRRTCSAIGVALASSPKGPFQAPGPGPLVCRPRRWTASTPARFTDSNGKQYLLYTSGKGKATIWLSSVRRGITPDRRPQGPDPGDGRRRQHRRGARDGPHGGNYVLFYSGNAFNSGKYFVNYATADSLTKPFSKQPGSCSTATRRRRVQQPRRRGGRARRKHDYLLFHAYTGPTQRPCSSPRSAGTATATRPRPEEPGQARSRRSPDRRAPVRSSASKAATVSRSGAPPGRGPL